MSNETCFPFLNDTLVSAFHLVIQEGVVDIPLLIVMNALWPLFGCMWVQPIVDFTSMLVAFYFLSSLQLRWRSKE